jgi:hypothetical protein
MTGREDFNFPAFFKTSALLRMLGHEVENPAENDGATLGEAVMAAHANENVLSWADYMRRDLRRLSTCDALCVLPEWQSSRGATLEVDIASRLGMPIMCIDGELLVPRVRAIGLSGYARAGKDTVAGILLDHGYQQASFAAALKEALLALDPLAADRPNWRISQIVHEPSDWEHAKDEYPMVRELLQRLGTEVGRKFFGDNVWVDLAFKAIPDGGKVVFADCRFPNEAAAIRATGGEVWRVARPGCGPINGHPSETALDGYDFDWHVWNNSTIEALRAAIGDSLHKAAAA